METAEQKKREIISLIVVDMRNRKLIIGLEQAGLNAERFYSELTEIILHRMGFEEISDDIYNWYHVTLEDLINVSVSVFMSQKNEIALKMYEQLVFRRQLNG